MARLTSLIFVGFLVVSVLVAELIADPDIDDGHELEKKKGSLRNALVRLGKRAGNLRNALVRFGKRRGDLRNALVRFGKRGAAPPFYYDINDLFAED